MEHIRRLAWGAFITNLGNGAWFTSWALYLTRHAGLSPGQVGLGMGLAAGLGMLTATPLGHLADRVGPRETFAALLLVQGAGTLLYEAVHSFATLLAAATLTVALTPGGVRGALVAGLAEDRLTALARLRVFNHAGTALGAVAGGVVIARDAGYGVLIAFDAATYVAYAAVVLGVPHVAGVPARGLAVVRDAPYVTLAAMVGVLSLSWGMLSAGVPLWIARHTDAPRSLAAAIVLVNAVGIAGLQVQVTRWARTPRAAARTALAAGVLLAASCVLFATGDVYVMLGAGFVHLGGELLFVAASWGLSIPLMPEGAAGAYQGMFATGEATAQAFAPVLMTTLVAGWGRPGWLVLGALFVLAAAPAPRVTAWALRARPSPSRSPDPRAPHAAPARPHPARSGP